MALQDLRLRPDLLGLALVYDVPVVDDVDALRQGQGGREVLLHQHDGQARGGQVAARTGESPYADIVVIRFPDVAAVDHWHSSPAYQSLIPLREQAADVVLLSYED
jgi:uncharacterized protein (DUF1330 family)